MLLADRQRGTLLALAIGDALGAAVEFKSPDTFREVTGSRGGGPHGLSAGDWTDDTSMALALADSVASVGWDLDDQADDELEPYEERLGAIEAAYRFDEGEVWSPGVSPEGYRELREEYGQAWDDLFARRLAEFGEPEMARCGQHDCR